MAGFVDKLSENQFAGQNSFLKSMASVGKGFSESGAHSLLDIDSAYGDMLKDAQSPKSLFNMARASQGFNKVPGLQSIEANKNLYAPMGTSAPFQGKMAELLSKYNIVAGVGQQPNGTTGTSGSNTSIGGDWAQVDSWNVQIDAAAQKYNVNPNLIKALMYTESGGVNAPANGAGAVGPMQIVPQYWSQLGYDLNDPAQNIMAGAAIISQLTQQCGSETGALNAYYSGSCTSTGARDDPAQGGSGMADNEYVAKIMSDYNMLNATGGNPSSNGTSVPTGVGGVQLSSFTGGNGSYQISQGLGPSDFSRANPSMYYYAQAFGVDGHPALDIATPENTQITTPFGGTVVCLGTSQYGSDTGGDGGCGAFGDDMGGIGRVQIRLDNGDHVIYGHMRSSSLQLGARVTAGTVVGLSGSAGTGAHVHVEYRKKGGNTSSGYTAVDPRTMQGMNVTGGATSGMSGTGYNVSVPLGTGSYGNGMIQGVRGLPTWYGSYRPGSIQLSRGRW